MAAQPGAGPYVAFASLPSLNGPLGAALGAGAAGAAAAAICLPPHLAAPVSSEAAGADAGAREAQAAFDLAREVIRDHEKWQARQAEAKQLREERNGLMAVALDESPSPPAAPAAAVTATPVGPVATPAPAAVAPVPVAAATPAPAPQPAAPVVQVTATPVPARADEVTLVFRFSDGKQVPAPFKISQGGFDVYAKAFELGGQQQPTIMKLSGPRGGASAISKDLDEDAWSFNLSGLGLQGGSTYDITVQH